MWAAREVEMRPYRSRRIWVSRLCPLASLRVSDIGLQMMIADFRRGWLVSSEVGGQIGSRQLLDGLGSLGFLGP